MIDTAAPTASDRAVFASARGYHYRKFLYQVHQTLSPEWYIEVGTARGDTLELAECNTIVVDPTIRIRAEALSGRPQTHIFAMTSDAFFDTGAAQRLTSRIDLAFLDGMHLFEYLLRDFMNTEKICGPTSVILLHDLIPPSLAAAERVWDRAVTKMWTGDVWKLALILREFRPDLTFLVADCGPSGVGVVTGLDPQNRVLDRNYDRILDRFSALSLDQISDADLMDGLRPISAKDKVFDPFAGPAPRVNRDAPAAN
jgi:hypothetical protein